MNEELSKKITLAVWLTAVVLLAVSLIGFLVMPGNGDGFKIITEDNHPEDAYTITTGWKINAALIGLFSALMVILAYYGIRGLITDERNLILHGGLILAGGVSALVASIIASGYIYNSIISAYNSLFPFLRLMLIFLGIGTLAVGLYKKHS